jgi:hypothetical protein
MSYVRPASLFSLRHVRTLMAAAATAGTLLFAGQAAATPAQANVIYVRVFDADANQVQLDSGLARQVETAATGGAASAQAQAAAAARTALADTIVQQLQARGLPAVPADGPVTPPAGALVVEGQVREMDEGSRRRRVLIGLGAGKSELGADVRISRQPASGAPVVVQQFVATADSGKMPGMAETGGIGAAAGHLGTAMAAGAGTHGAAEARRGSLEADAARLGNAIAARVAAASATGAGLAS